MNRSQLAFDLFLQGCNCSQAVFCAFSDLTGIDREMALKLSCSFGGGMGRLREVCGAVSGMLMALGAIYGYTDVSDPRFKSEHYKIVQRLCKRFSDETGTIVCRELLGLKGASKPESPPRNDEFYRTRPCPRVIMLAASILEDYIKENPI